MLDIAPRIPYDAFVKTAPAAYAALAGLSKAVHDAGLDDALVELVKVRASQINGCAFCLQYHLNVARKLGVPAPKLDLMAAWHDAGVFTERECAALAWTEALTRVADAAPSDAAWQALRAQFSEQEAIFLTVAIGAINSWNRIGASLRFAPPIPKTDGR